MTLALSVELLSDAAPGSGAGGPDVDRDLVLDGAGLPILSGRRLKGLLREASLEVEEAFTLAGASEWLARELCPTSLLFGTPEQPGILRLGDAQLAEHAGGNGAELGAWLRWAAAEAPLFGRGMLPALTVVRTQTALDPATGMALEHALRTTRLLRRGLHFAGSVELGSGDAALTARSERTLALACAAFRRLGSSRHRGAGSVRARLWESDRGDLTAQALQTLGETSVSERPKRRGR